MFRQLAATVGAGNLIREPAGLLAVRLEVIWAARARAAAVTGYPIPVGVLPAAIRPGNPAVWDHLIYAYLIENTRAPEIIRRVISEITHGERLVVPRNNETFEWLRSTEELFFSYGPPLLAMSTVSQLRPDPRATRRNAYFRMFGMDLNHGADDGSPFPYQRAEVANRDFVPTFEAFLRETWRAIENANNQIGANPTATAAIADLALRLQTMLNERRGGSAVAANLAREEFSAVAFTSWLHVLLDFDNNVLADLRAQGTTPEERLARLGEKVGLPSHAHSHSYFMLAPIVSLLLIEIEAGLYSTSAGAQALFLPARPAANPIRDDIETIVDHWSRATGRNLKATLVTAGGYPMGVAGVTAARRTSVTSGMVRPAAAGAGGRSTNGQAASPEPIGV